MKRFVNGSVGCAIISTMIAMIGCSPSAKTTNGTATSGDATATSAGSSAGGSFSLAWSEYPSWSVFGVADEIGLINKAEGKKGTMEEKWGVDIVLKQLDYEVNTRLVPTVLRSRLRLLKISQLQDAIPGLTSLAGSSEMQ